MNKVKAFTSYNINNLALTIETFLFSKTNIEVIALTNCAYDAGKFYSLLIYKEKNN